MGIGLGLAAGIGGLAQAGATVAGAAISSHAVGEAADRQAQATEHAAQMQADASRYATDFQKQQFQQQQENIRPWIDAGKGALPELQSMAGAPVSFTAQDFQNNMDPAYQFDLQQGQQAVQRSAAARGSLMSGGTLKDLTSYSQGMASHEYQNAYNRFMNNQNTRFNRLASVAGIGQTGTGMLSNAGMNAANSIGNIATGTANSIGNMTMGLGNAQAGAAIAQGNIWGNSLSGMGNNFSNTLMMGSLMSHMNQNPGGSGLEG